MVGKVEVESLVEKLKEMRDIEDELWRRQRKKSPGLSKGRTDAVFYEINVER